MITIFHQHHFVNVSVFCVQTHKTEIFFYFKIFLDPINIIREPEENWIFYEFSYSLNSFFIIGRVQQIMICTVIFFEVASSYMDCNGIAISNFF